MQLHPDTLIADVCKGCYESYVEAGESFCMMCLAERETTEGRHADAYYAELVEDTDAEWIAQRLWEMEVVTR